MSNDNQQRFGAKLINFADDERIELCEPCLRQAMAHSLVVFSSALPATAAEGKAQLTLAEQMRTMVFTACPICGGHISHDVFAHADTYRCMNQKCGWAAVYSMGPDARAELDRQLADNDNDDGSKDWCDDCRGYTHKYDCPSRPAPTPVQPPAAPQDQARECFAQIERLANGFHNHSPAYGHAFADQVRTEARAGIRALAHFPPTEATQPQTWCDHCSADLNGVKHILCERCYRDFAESINTRESLRATILDWLAHRCDRAPVCGNCTYCRVASFVRDVEPVEIEKEIGRAIIQTQREWRLWLWNEFQIDVEISNNEARNQLRAKFDTARADAISAKAVAAAKRDLAEKVLRAVTELWIDTRFDSQWRNGFEQCKGEASRAIKQAFADSGIALTTTQQQEDE